MKIDTNKLNVSIYAIDAAGLRAINPNQEARDEINALGRRRVDADSMRPETGRPMTAMLERNEDLIKLNPQSGLTQLAIETGGAFIGDTNNVGMRLRQVDEDLHTYYLVSYVPTNQNIDGKFRQISVKPKRDEWEVQTRKGYFAVNATGWGLLKPFLETTTEELQRMTALQYIGPFQFFQAMIKAMPKGGSLIQISSATAKIMLNDHAAYMGTKAGTDHVIRCIKGIAASS